jgi:hypothetical protein
MYFFVLGIFFKINQATEEIEYAFFSTLMKIAFTLPVQLIKFPLFVPKQKYLLYIYESLSVCSLQSLQKRIKEFFLNSTGNVKAIFIVPEKSAHNFKSISFLAWFIF